MGRAPVLGGEKAEVCWRAWPVGQAFAGTKR
jgi:hypothetical protein